MTTLATALREVGTAKEIARLCGKPHRTVERWMQDRADPPASTIFRLMRASRRFREAIDRMTNEDWMTRRAESLDREVAEIRARLAAQKGPNASHHSPTDQAVPMADAQAVERLAPEGVGPTLRAR